MLNIVQAEKNAEARAAIFGFIASLLNHAPDSDLIQGLRAADISVFLESIPERDPSRDIKQGLSELSEFMGATAEMPASETALLLAEDWTRLFRGVRPGYGPSPPYEGLYRSDDHLGVDAIQAVNHWYLENDVGVDTEHPDRPDYLGLEMDFIRHLSELEARGWGIGNREEATEYLERGNLFFAEHIATWVPYFCEEAMGFAKTGFYRGLIKMIQGVIVDASP